MKQVAKSHYDFRRYMDKERWISTWHQLDEVIRLSPKRVLEIGPGPGVFKAAATRFGIHVETADIDSDLGPDHVASATHLPFVAGSFDVVCAFQVLEHVPYATALQAFAELVRVSANHVIISLPDVKPVIRSYLYIPRRGTRTVLIPKPNLGSRPHIFDGQHYWEINKREYPLRRVSSDLSKSGRLEKTYRVPENPYHRMFVFTK